MYKPGLHIISEFDVNKLEYLYSFEKVKDYFDKAISMHGLSNVGEVYHQFPEAGYTASICLTESHISIHTWPEYGRVTFDVFLSNYKNVNNHIAEEIHEGLLSLLGAFNVTVNKIAR